MKTGGYNGTLKKEKEMVWMSEIWELEKSKLILPSGEEKVIEGEVTAETVKEIARELGLKKFTVEDEEGNLLTQDDFPRTGTIYIKEYNEAK